MLKAVEEFKKTLDEVGEAKCGKQSWYPKTKKYGGYAWNAAVGVLVALAFAYVDNIKGVTDNLDKWNGVVEGLFQSANVEMASVGENTELELQGDFCVCLKR